MSEEFSGFPAQGLEFLAELGRSDKAWFTEHRKTYDRHVVAPTKAFVETIGSRLSAAISPTISAQPKTNGSIAPINNDLRFSPDKPPYKDHLLLRFWDGPDKKTAPSLMIRIAQDEIGFSSGAAITDNTRWRELIDDNTNGQALVAALDALGDIPDLDVADDRLKNVPTPYPADHPRSDLLRNRGIFHVRWPEPTPPTIHTTDFVDHCTERLEQCRDLHHWFLNNLSAPT